MVVGNSKFKKMNKCSALADSEHLCVTCSTCAFNGRFAVFESCWACPYDLSFGSTFDTITHCHAGYLLEVILAEYCENNFTSRQITDLAS